MWFSGVQLFRPLQHFLDTLNSFPQNDDQSGKKFKISIQNEEVKRNFFANIFFSLTYRRPECAK